MKIVYLSIFLLYCDFVKNESLLGNDDQISKNAIYAETLSDVLIAQRWEENEKPCLDTMMSILDNAKNFTLWAVWILDSLQPPVGQFYGQKHHLANYDECLKPDYGFRVGPMPRTQYCVAKLDLTGTEEMSKPIDYVWFDHNVTADAYLKRPTKHGRVMSYMIWGVCVPQVCQPSAVAKVARSLLKISHLGVLSDTAGINVSHCENREVLEEASTGLKIFILVVLLLAAVALFCTHYVKSGKAAPGTFVGELANSFNISRNLATLTKIRDDEVYSMNLMKVFTSLSIVCFHHIFFSFPYYIVNGLDTEKWLDVKRATHFDVVVDTFLTVSGLLFVRGLISDKSQNPLKCIWKRYIRLTLAMVALMFYMSTGHIRSGPIWHRTVGIETEICKRGWPTNLLMISNIYADKMCVLATWYVPCDYQLCVFATILFVIYKKNSFLGKCAFAVSFVAAIVIPGVLTYMNGLAPILLHGVESLGDCRHDPEAVQFYSKSYCRAGPFLVGAWMGYLMYTYKPKDYRKTVGTFASFLCLVFSLVVMYEVLVFGDHFYSQGEPLGSAIYAAVNRTIWGLAICVIIGVSEYGNLSILNSVFSWYPLVPLSRLTYGVYLTHYPILELYFFSMRTMLEFDIFRTSVVSAGTTMFALQASFIIWLLFEAPIININNMLLDNTWKKKTKEPVHPNKNKIHEGKKLI